MKRVIVLLMILSSGCTAFAQALSPGGALTEKQLHVLEVYTKRILRKLPVPFTQNAVVNVYFGTEPDVDIRENGTIWISSEFFSAFESEEERLAVLAHEISHRLLNHKSAELFNWGRAPAYDLPLLEQNEVEADWYSVLLLTKAGVNICVAERSLQTIIDGYNMGRSPNTPVHRIHFKRLGLPKTYCHNKRNLGYLRPASLTDERLKELGPELK